MDAAGSCVENFNADATLKSVHAEGLPSSVVGLFSEPRNGDVIVVSKCGVAVLVGRDEVLHVNCSPLRRDPDLNLVAAVY